MIEKLILIRHGETLHNVAGIAQGWNDSALSQRGEEQVARLTERVATMNADAIISSPLGRALSTANVLARACGLEVTTLDELREMNYGGWEGRSFLDVRRQEASSYEEWIANADCPCPGGGESHNAVTLLLDLPVMASRHFAQDNAAMNVFLWRGDRWVLKSWNVSE